MARQKIYRVNSVKEGRKKISISRGQFIARFIGDFEDRLENGNVHVVQPIWNGMIRELAEQGYAPEVHDGKMYIRIFSRTSKGGTS
ncbi:MAG: hypothetical protein HY709_10240 [Candidatus Latescibacteria bacterium]|nr:hypothetical protein [Candidatus Latescibacterota bacterium]